MLRLYLVLFCRGKLAVEDKPSGLTSSVERGDKAPPISKMGPPSPSTSQQRWLSLHSSSLTEVRFQSEGSASGRIVVYLMRDPHREGLCRGCASISPLQGNQGGDRSGWCEGWTPPHLYLTSGNLLLHLQSLLALNSRLVSFTAKIFRNCNVIHLHLKGSYLSIIDYDQLSISKTTPNNCKLACYFNLHEMQEHPNLFV